MGFIMYKLSVKIAYSVTDSWLPLFGAILRKIGNVWALTTTKVCSALNKVRAMKLCMVLVTVSCMDSYLNFVRRFGGNTVFVL